MRYFFNVRIDGLTAQDIEGQDCPSDDAARAEALSVARELIGRLLLGDKIVDWTGVVEIVRGDQLVGSIGFMEAAGIPALFIRRFPSRRRKS